MLSISIRDFFFFLQELMNADEAYTVVGIWREAATRDNTIGPTDMKRRGYPWQHYRPNPTDMNRSSYPWQHYRPNPTDIGTIKWGYISFCSPLMSRVIDMYKHSIQWSCIIPNRTESMTFLDEKRDAWMVWHHWMGLLVGLLGWKNGWLNGMASLDGIIGITFLDGKMDARMVWHPWIGTVIWLFLMGKGMPEWYDIPGLG